MRPAPSPFARDMVGHAHQCASSVLVAGAVNRGVDGRRRTPQPPLRFVRSGPLDQHRLVPRTLVARPTHRPGNAGATPKFALVARPCVMDPMVTRVPPLRLLGQLRDLTTAQQDERHDGDGDGQRHDWDGDDEKRHLLRHRLGFEWIRRSPDAVTDRGRGETKPMSHARSCGLAFGPGLRGPAGQPTFRRPAVRSHLAPSPRASTPCPPVRPGG